MNEFQKLQRMRIQEQAEAENAEQAIPIPINDHRDEAATHSMETGQKKRGPSEEEPLH